MPRNDSLPAKKTLPNGVRCLRQFSTLVALLACSIAHAVPTNDELKVAYIARFTEFIEWPETTADTPPAFKICVFGDAPILQPLQQLPQLMKDNHRNVDIRRIDQAQESFICNILFVPHAANAHLAKIASHTRHKPILVINEVQGVPGHGQLISLYTEGERLRIEIHLRETEDAGLKISSRLLKLANVVE